MPRIATLLLFAVCLGVLPMRAEDRDSMVIHIDSVRITGNDRTRDEVILREIPFAFPADLTMADFEYIRNRLTNLFLFNRARLVVEESDDGNVLHIELTETLHIYPVPILFLNDRSWDKVSAGFQVTHINFRGMNERLGVGGWLGHNPSFFVNYSNPWIGRQRLLLGFDTFGKRVSNKFVESLESARESGDTLRTFTGYGLEERHLGVGMTIGRRLNLHSSIQAFIGVRRIVIPERLPESLARFEGRHVVPKFELAFRSDYRDLYEYPRSGFLIQWKGTRSGLGGTAFPFWRLNLDHRVYLPLGSRVSLGMRNGTTLNSTNPPIYDRTFIGFGERVRGHFYDDEVAGQHRMMHSAEMRISLLPIRYFSVDDAPVMPNLFQQLKYGLSMGLFVDSGIVWGESDRLMDGDLRETDRPLSLRNHITGYGVGLHIHLPYVYLLRLDHAWDEDGRGEWILEAGVTF